MLANAGEIYVHWQWRVASEENRINKVVNDLKANKPRYDSVSYIDTRLDELVALLSFTG